MVKLHNNFNFTVNEREYITTIKLFYYWFRFTTEPYMAIKFFISDFLFIVSFLLIIWSVSKIKPFLFLFYY